MSARLLDLFCGAGGAGEGYRRAGFTILGVDITDHPDYPGHFILTDWADALRIYGDWADVIHASPPCPRYSVATPAHARDKHPDLIGPVREALEATGKPYIIENVPGSPLVTPCPLLRVKLRPARPPAPTVRDELPPHRTPM